MDEEGKVQDPNLHETLNNLVAEIIKGMSGAAKSFYEREFDFFGKITGRNNRNFQILFGYIFL